MKLFLVFLFFFLVAAVFAADQCGVCKASVKAIKDGKGLAYMADLTTQQIEAYITKNVKKNCPGSSCSKLIKDLIEIADQLDDDMDSTPEELCKFVNHC